ncbi:citrate synthase, putative [Eimeria brunetti]|uniref:Citrate synthase, putative n=1 Tax=Eimeria brunetti TaxID=51314 RepID=U6LUJ1_9EIME|nr:citrate synthase, putative [Eimeria brunetti]
MRRPLSNVLLGPMLPAAAATAAAAARTAAAAAKTHPLWAAAAAAAALSKGAAANAAAADFGRPGFLAARRSFSSSSSSNSSSSSSNGGPSAAVQAAVEALQQQLAAAAAEKQQRMQRLREKYGAARIGAVTPVNVMGGMRGLPALFTETSLVDAEKGLRVHNIPMRELLLQQLPKAQQDPFYPSVEALLWFLLTSKVPTASEVSLLQRCLYEMMVSAAAAPQPAAAAGAAGAGAAAAAAAGGKLSVDSYAAERFVRVPAALQQLLQSLPREGHPMAAFAAAAAALSDFSFFRAAVEEGLFNKKNLWKPALADALALATNFARFLGFEGEQQQQLLRLYLLLHADHEATAAAAAATAPATLAAATA